MFRVVKCSLLIRNQPTKQTEQQQQQKTPKKETNKKNANKQKNATIATTESRHYLVLAYWFCSFYRSFTLTFLSFDLNFFIAFILIATVFVLSVCLLFCTIIIASSTSASTISLSLAGNSGHLTWVRHSSRKSSATIPISVCCIFMCANNGMAASVWDF